jgi:enoyl-CoA hydratase/carnithine racemase
VLPAALELARDIAVNASPAAVSASKRLLWDAFPLSVSAIIERENRAVFWLGRQPDTLEGIAAYMQKRSPKWASRASDVPADVFE